MNISKINKFTGACDKDGNLIYNNNKLKIDGSDKTWIVRRKNATWWVCPDGEYKNKKRLHSIKQKLIEKI